MPDDLPTIPAEVLMPSAPIDDATLEALFATAGQVDDGPEPEPVRRARGWEPDDTAAAEWAMGKAAAARARIREVEAQARDWHAQIDAWAAAETSRPADTEAFFERALEGYLRRLHEADPKLRTSKLPSGVMKVTVPKSGRVVVVDDGPLIEWLERQPGDDVDAIVKRPAPTVLVSVLRQRVRAVPTDDGGWRAVDPETGETPPGVAAEPPGEPIYRIDPYT